MYAPIWSLKVTFVFVWSCMVPYGPVWSPIRYPIWSFVVPLVDLHLVFCMVFCMFPCIVSHLVPCTIPHIAPVLTLIKFPEWYLVRFLLWFQILLHLALSWILSKAENLVSTSLQDGATKWGNHPATHPQPIWFDLRCPFHFGPMFRKYVWCPPPLPIGALFRKYVQCPPSEYTLFLCGVPPNVILCLWHIWPRSSEVENLANFAWTINFSLEG